MPTPERLAHSFLATAWAAGFPHQSPHVENAGDFNPWATVTIHYHYHEALVIRFWAMQAEATFGYLSKIMRMTEEEFAVPVRKSKIEPLDVLRAMTQWSLARAGHRALVAGSPGIILPEDATKIYNSVVPRYETLVAASVKESRPIPEKDFQLGLSRDHPWTAFICYCADNICGSLDLEEDTGALVSIVMQLVVSNIQNGLYRALLTLP